MERLSGRLMLLWGWRRALVAWLAGALAALSQPPFDFFAVCLVSFPVLVWLLDGAAGDAGRARLRRLAPSFAVGWWFGFGYFVAGLWWTGAAMLVQADEFAWALPFAVFGLPALLAIFFGLATALARLLWSDGIGRIAALAAAFGLTEWLRATILSGFPWNALGQSAMPTPLLMQSLSVVGMYGMNSLAVFVFAMPALFAARRHQRVGLALALVLVAAHAGYGYVRLRLPDQPTDKTIAVRLVQPSILQDKKWDQTARDDIFRTYLELSGRAPAAGQPKPQLIVWPETAVPFLLTDRPDALVALGQLLESGQTLLAGAVRSEGDSGSAGASRYYNSVVAINDRGEITDAVDKLYLVPFGEYLPFEDALATVGVHKLVELPGGFSAGTSRHAIEVAPGVKVVPFICYEVIFPGLASREASGGDIIVNVTNDAWFGNTPGPYQHLRQAQLRAVEAGLPVIRAANNGVSAIIDTRGRILDGLALNSVGILDFTLTPAHAATTFTLRQPWAASILILTALTALALALAHKTGKRIDIDYIRNS